MERPVSLTLAASDWSFESDAECDLNFTIHGECSGSAPECELWIGFGTSTQFVMLNINIEDKNNPTNEILAAPSINTTFAANGDISYYFFKTFKDRDFPKEAVIRFGNMSFWNSLDSRDDGWPIGITFRSFNDSVNVYWNGVLLSSWDEFVLTDSDLTFVVSHNLKNGEDVDIYGIAIARHCTVPTTTRTPTTFPSVPPTADDTVTVDPSFVDTDTVSLNVSGDITTDIDTPKWELDTDEMSEWYVP